MEFLSVVAAAVVSFGIGAGYYGALAKPWIAASGVECDADGQPKGSQNPMTYALAFVLQLIVVGMMRHVFTLSGIDTLGAGLVSGLGIGLFFITPWIALNNLYGGRPVILTVIDGGYATLACAAAGLVLTLF